MNVYNAALSRLEHRSRTVYEMRKYLSSKGFDEEEIEETVKELAQLGYLDDFRYCQEYLPYAFRKGKSKKRALYELKLKGIDLSIAEQAFSERDEEFDEKKIAMGEVNKILKAENLEEGGDIPEKVLARIGRRLSCKGFSAGLIYEIIGDLKR